MALLENFFFFRSCQEGVKRISKRAHCHTGFDDVAPRSRIAKADRAWWLPYTVIGSVIVTLNGGYFLFSSFYQWRRTRLLEKREALLLEDMDKWMKDNPQLAVAAVQMGCHHLWSQASTPFGAPMVAPPYYREEAIKLKGLVEMWQRNYPHLCSVADMWALVCRAGLAAVGGPRLVPTMGREDTSGKCTNSGIEMNDQEGLSVYPLLRMLPSTIEEKCRDARDIKRVLVNEGLSLDQMVALFGLTRLIGFHPYKGMNLDKRNTKCRLFSFFSQKRRSMSGVSAVNCFYRCSSTPYHYSNEYFRLLLNSNWDLTERQKKIRASCEESASSQPPSYCYCRKEDPSSLSPCRPVVLTSSSSSTTSDVVPSRSSVLDTEIFCFDEVMVSDLDLSLRNDRGTRAIVKLFASDEKLLDYVVKNLFVDILQRGHNVNRIYELSS